MAGGNEKHYTKPEFASALINLVPGVPSQIIDPAAGDGALLQAATNRWPNVSLLGFDISRDAILEARRKLPHAKLLCVDALHKTWTDSNGKGFPLLLCNPPFQGESHLTFAKRSDVQFFDRALDSVNDRGAILFVLPNSIASSPSFLELRVRWLCHHTLKAAIALPQNAFKNTQASAVAIVLVPGTHTQRAEVDFVSLGRNAKVLQRSFGRIDSTYRFDPHYYLCKQAIPKIRTDAMVIETAVDDIRRGIFVKKASIKREKPNRYIHSTDLRWGWLSNQNGRFVGPNIQLNVHTGSVLISRVGKGLWRKSALYAATNPATASDCVYIVKTASLMQSAYLAAMLTTKFMELSIRSVARGITVPILNKKDLLRLSVPWLPTREQRQIAEAWLRAERRDDRLVITTRLDQRIAAKF